MVNVGIPLAVGAKVGVIGAGPRGMAVARNFLDHGFQVQMYDLKDDFGGVWHLGGGDNQNWWDHGYPHLRFVLPVQIFQFWDEEVMKSKTDYATVQEAEHFIQEYGKKHDLAKHCRFNSRVTNVDPVSTEGPWQGWKIEYEDTNDPSRKQVDIVDAITLATGKFQKPYIPQVPGAMTFPGPVIHSKDYMGPEPFKHMKAIALAGHGDTARDIAIVLSKYVDKVYLCYTLRKGKSKFRGQIPNLVEITRIKEMHPDSTISFELDPHTGQTPPPVKVDAVIYCTGYEQAYPILGPNSGVEFRVEEKDRLYPVWKQMININYPTMLFVSIQTYFGMVPTHYQAEFASRLWLGEIPLPSKEEMLRDAEETDKQRFSKYGNPRRWYHSFGKYLSEYMGDLSAHTGLPSLPTVYEEMIRDSNKAHTKDPVGFQRRRYAITGPDSWTVDEGRS